MLFLEEESKLSSCINVISLEGPSMMAKRAISVEWPASLTWTGLTKVMKIRVWWKVIHVPYNPGGQCLHPDTKHHQSFPKNHHVVFVSIYLNHFFLTTQLYWKYFWVFKWFISPVLISVWLLPAWIHLDDTGGKKNLGWKIFDRWWELPLFLNPP